MSVAIHTAVADQKLPLTDYHASICAGRYEVRFARSYEELQGAQALRYRTLFVEGGGKISEDMAQLGREEDPMDAFARHVIVLDTQGDYECSSDAVVGTLRLTSSVDLARAQEVFYTEQAYDIQCLRARYAKILELSRFCIDSEGRTGSILMLIWKFTLQYILEAGYDLMIGCASFPGADLSAHRNIFSYLYKHNLAPPEFRCPARSEAAVDLHKLAGCEVDWQQAKQSIPTLLRGYLKIGARISDQAIIDPVFNTVFVAVYVDSETMVVRNHTLARSSKSV